jgi:hypothetical protein
MTKLTILRSTHEVLEEARLSRTIQQQELDKILTTNELLPRAASQRESVTQSHDCTHSRRKVAGVMQLPKGNLVHLLQQIIRCALRRYEY